MKNWIAPEIRQLMFVRSPSIDGNVRDALQLAEQSLEWIDSFSILDVVVQAFGHNECNESIAFSSACACIEVASLLDFDLSYGLSKNTQQLAVARDWYYDYAMARFIEVFDGSNDFWNVFNYRMKAFGNRSMKHQTGAALRRDELANFLSSNYGGFLVPIDALYFCDNQRSSLTHGLLIQAHKWIITACLGPMIDSRMNKQECLKRALRLAEPLGLSEYEKQVHELSRRLL